MTTLVFVMDKKMGMLDRCLASGKYRNDPKFWDR